MKTVFVVALLTLLAGMGIPAARGMFPAWILLVAILTLCSIALCGFRLDAGLNLRTIRRAIWSFGLFLACTSQCVPEVGSKFPSWVWTGTGLTLFMLCLLRSIDFLVEE